ncbi:MAG TPA: hypothetical protein HPQ04_08060 [Rhodospirillaceae bacterium]|nr:hypothetical protein [Rhodospirillaceae bacterium]
MTFKGPDGLNVLIATENKACGRQVQSMLRAMGIGELTEVFDLSHAILQLSHGGKIFSLVICDFLGQDGHLKLMKFVRNEQKLFPADTPVICIGALWTPDSIKAAHAGGVSAMLKLPVTDKDLGRVLSMLRQKAVVAPKPFPATETLPPQRGTTLDPAVINTRPKSEITGLEVIDEEHKLFFFHLSMLNKAIKEWQGGGEVENTLAVFRKFIAMHFSHEESLMESFPYSSRQVHKSSHDELNERLREDSAQAKGDAGKYARLASFLYEWMIDHISGFDQKMVAALRLHVLEAAKTDRLAAQTATVVHTAFTLAMKIPVLSLRLDMDWSNTNQRSLNAKIGDIFERMTNLMVLAESRIRSFGCNDHQLALLQEIQKAVAANAEVMVVSATKQLIHYGKSIVAGVHGLPLGIGTAINFQLSSVMELVSVAGGIDAISESSRAFVDRARDLVDSIVAMEKGSSVALADHGTIDAGMMKHV